MKLKNKILIILLVCIGLFIISDNKSYCASDDEYIVHFTANDVYYTYTKTYDELLGDYSHFVLYDDYLGNSHLIRYNSGDVSLAYLPTRNGYLVCLVCSDSSARLEKFHAYGSDSFCSFTQVSASTGSISLYQNEISSYDVDTYKDYVTFVASSDFITYSEDTSIVVFREVGGATDGLQNPYGNYEYDGNTNNSGNTIDDNFEDTTDTGWLSGFINWLLTPFRYFAQILGNIWDYITGFLGRLLAGLFDFVKTIFVPNPDDFKFDEVKEVMLDKFPFIDSFSQILTGFNNAFNEESGQPNFTITLPAFLGGATVNAIDFRFYNQYRSWIHGFIIASCYFLYIRRMYHKIPKIVKGE